MAGAPWLDAPLGDGAALRQPVKLLKDVGNVEILFHPPADGVFKVLFDLVLDYESDLAKTGAIGVVKGKVDDGVSAPVHSLDLLQPAEAAAHPGGQDDKGRFLHVLILFFTVS